MSDSWCLPKNVKITYEAMWDCDMVEVIVGRSTLKVGLCGILYYTLYDYKMSADILLIETNKVKTYAINIEGKQYMKKAP